MDASSDPGRLSILDIGHFTDRAGETREADQRGALHVLQVDSEGGYSGLCVLVWAIGDDGAVEWGEYD